MGERVPTGDLPRNLVPASDMPDGAPAEPVAASQRDVRMAEPAVARPSKLIRGDAGAALAAGEAFGAMNDLIDRGSTWLGGAVTDTGMKLGASPEGAAAVGAGTKAIGELAPSMAGGLVGSAMKAPAAAGRWMQSALKPTLEAIRSGKAERAVGTMLEKGVPATRAGVDQMVTRVNELEKQAEQLVQASKGTLTMDDVMSRLLPVYDKALESPGWKTEVAPISAAAAEMRSHPLAGDTLTVQAAQALKEGAYRKIGYAGYGAGLKPAAERDANKAFARGLKEDIEKAVPGVAPLNKETSDLINAIKVTARRTGMEANKNPVGLGWLLAPGHSPEATLAFMAWMAERSPAVKSAIAQQLYSGSGGRNLGALLGGTDAYVNSTLGDMTRK